MNPFNDDFYVVYVVSCRLGGEGGGGEARKNRELTIRGNEQFSYKREGGSERREGRRGKKHKVFWKFWSQRGGGGQGGANDMAAEGGRKKSSLSMTSKSGNKVHIEANALVHLQMILW